MTVKIGINGFGRMGRLGLRTGWGREDIAVTQVNEIATDATGSAHLFKFDSVHGTWAEECSADGDAMFIGGQPVAYSRNATIDETDWSGCDIVIEATGKHHKKPETLQTYFDQGVKNVIALRAVETTDFMTANWAHLPYPVLAKVSNRIINEVRGISRITYDISGKPPATIEWE